MYSNCERLMHKGKVDSGFTARLQKMNTETAYLVPNILIYQIQSGPKKCIHSLLINIIGINLNEISISG